MVNPIPAGWQTLASTVSKIAKEQQEQHQMAPRSHPVVFDTMVDETWQTRAGAGADAGSTSNIRRHNTNQQDEHNQHPKQFFIHSQQQTSSTFSLTKDVKSFFETARSLDIYDDDDALYWCE